MIKQRITMTSTMLAMWTTKGWTTKGWTTKGWTIKGWTTKGDRALRVQRLMVVSRETRGGSSDSGGRGTEGERANPERRTYYTTINSELRTYLHND